MFCTVCGSEIPLSAEACPTCGRSLETAGAAVAVRSGSASAHSSVSSGSWPRPVAIGRTPASQAELSAPEASIHAGDLEQSGFPRTLSGRVVLLTGVVMMADLLLPWVSVNGLGYAPTRFALPALAVALTLALMLVAPLEPHLRRQRITRALPVGIGALMLGSAGTIWLITGPLASELLRALVGRIAVASGIVISGSVVINTPSGAVLTTSPLSVVQIAPSMGLYLFIMGACALLVAGYFTLASRNQG